MTEPVPTEPAPTQRTTRDARSGDGDPRHDPAAIGEARLQAPDADGGSTPHAVELPEPGTGQA